MVDIGVALTWIAISALSVVGLSAYGRAVAAGERERELAPLPVDAWAGAPEPYVLGAYRPAGMAHR